MPKTKGLQSIVRKNLVFKNLCLRYQKFIKNKNQFNKYIYAHLKSFSVLICPPVVLGQLRNGWWIITVNSGGLT